jgi:AsmA protein
MVRLLTAPLFLATRLIQLAVLVEVALLLVDLEPYRAQLERSASDALAMEVRIEGPVRLSVLAGPRIALHDVRVRSGGVELAAVDSARLGLHLAALDARQLPGAEVELHGVRLHIERNHRGFNFALARRPGQAPPTFALARLHMSDASLRFADRVSGFRLDADGCRLSSREIGAAGAAQDDLWRALAFRARLDCRRIRSGDIVLTRVRAHLSAERGVLTLDPVEWRALGGVGRGSLRAHLAGAVPRFETRVRLSRLRAEELSRGLPGNTRAHGALDLSLDLSLRGTGRAALVRSAEGEIGLRGRDLVLEGIDLDQVISRFESSQRVKLLDFGALLYAGPLGLLFSRGVNLASAIPDSGGRTHVSMVVSDWKLTGGVAQAQDVAFATRAHRIALRGNIDLHNERFDNLVFAVVGADGCARLPHSVNGPFDAPELDRPGALASFAGPVLRLFRGLSGCEVFYAGAVPAPS